MSDTYMVSLSILRIRMPTAKKRMVIAQERYKRDLEQMVRTPLKRVIIGSRVFVRKDYYPADETRHKLEPLLTVPNTVTEVNENTCFILRENKITELITLDRVLLEPKVGTAESSNTKEMKGSRGYLQRIQDMYTNKTIVPQDDTTDTPG